MRCSESAIASSISINERVAIRLWILGNVFGIVLGNASLAISFLPLYLNSLKAGHTLLRWYFFRGNIFKLANSCLMLPHR